MISDKTIFQNGRMNLGVTCMGCNNNDHEIDICHKLHLVIPKYLTIYKYLYSIEQNRRKFNRPDRRTTNARFGQHLFEHAATSYQENHLTIYSENTHNEDDLKTRTIHKTQKSQSQHGSSSNNKFRKRSRSLNSGSQPLSEIHSVGILCI